MKGNLAHLAVISDGREYARVPQTYCMRMRMWGGGVGFGHKSCDFDVIVAFFQKVAPHNFVEMRFSITTMRKSFQKRKPGCT